MRALLVAGFVVAMAVPARAEPGARLEWMGTACHRDAVVAEVIDQLGRDPFTTPGPRLQIAVVEAPTLSATVALVDDDGAVLATRTVVAADCAELTRSLAVVIVLVAGAEPSAALSAEVAPPPPEPVAGIEERIVLAPRGGSAAAAAAAVSAGIAGGAAGDDWQAALVAGVRVRHGGRSIGLELELRAPDERVVDALGRVRVTSAAIVMTPCAYIRSLATCAVVAGGWLHGRGSGLADARSAVNPLAEVGARLAWQHRLTRRITAEARADLRVNLVTTTYRVDGMAVWSAQRVEGWLGLGLVAPIR